MRISDWSSDVCSSDLVQEALAAVVVDQQLADRLLHAVGVLRGELLAVVHHLRQLAAIGGAGTGEHELRAVAVAARDFQDGAGGVQVDPNAEEIGRASWRERVCQYV